MNHSFDIEHARKYGLSEAIMLWNFQHWISTNTANRRNFHKGRYWSYNSVKAFQEQFPYLTSHQIRRALESLIDQGALVKDTLSPDPKDRTLWYAFSDGFLDGNKISHLAETANAVGEKRNCSVNTDNKQNLYVEAFEKTWQAYPKRSGANKKQAYAAWQARVHSGHSTDVIHAGVEAYAAYVKAKKTEDTYIKQAVSFFGPQEHFLSDWKVYGQEQITPALLANGYRMVGGIACK